jgi:methylase of polypeptide subunit release factors
VLNPSIAASVLREVAATGYRFTAVTPLTHQRVLARRGAQTATTLPEVFGWNLPFATGAITAALQANLQEAGMLERVGADWRSTCRIASIDDDLFLHSGYPTVQSDAVFFGPDTYRFVRLLKQSLWRSGPTARAPAPLRVLDIGCGSGAGGIVVARTLAAVGVTASVTMNDINPIALGYTAVNAEVAGLAVTLAEGDALSAVVGTFDLIVCNPPYLDDDAQRAYRHGGSGLGRALGVRIGAEALARLAPGGRLVLYTGVAIVDGQDPFLAEVQPLLQKNGCVWTYEEIDPDVFGEELERPVYAGIDRIAAVGLIAERAIEASRPLD